MNHDAPIRNRNIEEFLFSGSFEIEESWGWAQLCEYLNDLELLRAGAKYEDLGISGRRHSALPSIISIEQGDKVRTIADRAVLRDESLTPSGAFAHLHLKGVMRNSDGASSRGVDSLVQDFRLAFENENIAGVLLEVDTGGGESSAGTKVQGVIASSPKPVVTWGHLVASAGIRATAPSDEIISSSLAAEFGSIGTYVTISKGFAEYYARNYTEVYADKSSKKNTAHREMMKGNLEPLKAYINKHNEFFLDEVQQYRPLRGNIEHTLSGEMFTAKEAKSRGLVDSIGNFNYALTRLQAAVKRRKMTK
jgi:protease-4